MRETFLRSSGIYSDIASDKITIKSEGDLGLGVGRERGDPSDEWTKSGRTMQH